MQSVCIPFIGQMVVFQGGTSGEFAEYLEVAKYLLCNSPSVNYISQVFANWIDHLLITAYQVENVNINKALS